MTFLTIYQDFQGGMNLPVKIGYFKEESFPGVLIKVINSSKPLLWNTNSEPISRQFELNGASLCKPPALRAAQASSHRVLPKTPADPEANPLGWN
jgi:hypothetical protein